jgi:AcrR family transcriptional regulator
MPEASAAKRTYNSPRRQAQAEATRRHILETARRLFRERGYAATTIPDVAHDASVSPRTVSLSFPTKRSLLNAVWDFALSARDDQVPVADRDWYRQMLAEPDPARQLDLVARNSTMVKQRLADMMEVIRDAAAADPEMADRWRTMQAEFRENQGRLVCALADKNGLRPGLAVEEATDLLWTLNHPDVYQNLVARCGWPPARYEQWLATTLKQQLLNP